MGARKLVVFFLLFAVAYGQQRSYCQGKSCSSTADCSQPDGFSGTVYGVCCSGQCWNQANVPTVALGGTCDNTDECMRCTFGYSCANGTGRLQGGGVLGPFTCQNIITEFTPDCPCNNSGQCIGGSCGTKKSVCIPDNLYSGSSCQFSSQCISGYCDGGKCQGRRVDDRTATCGEDNDCPLDHVCGAWQSPPAVICHGLSGTGGVCYSDRDCAANRFQVEPQEECVGATGGGPGQCSRLPGKGEVCGTSTTPDNCAYYELGAGYRTPYYCNTTLNPPRCMEYSAAPGLASGAVCHINVSPDCDSGLYCETDTKQPGNTNDPGHCVAYGNVIKGGNCSDYSACMGNTECRQNTDGVYQCQDISFGKACDHTSTTDDDIQCPSAFNQFVCGCNNTCVYYGSGSSSTCTARQNARFYGLFNDFGSSEPPTYASPAWANYQGDRRALADRACCNGCGTSAEAADARSYGVTINCESLTISIPRICDASYKPQKFLDKCANYKPNAASTLSFSSMVLCFSSLVALLNVYN